MAYGITCPICGAIVDNNEYSYARDMCMDCIAEQEQKEIKSTEMARLMNAPCEQMTLEV
jgi:NMD protein affecting ribosome stability and mRNA decay